MFKPKQELRRGDRVYILSPPDGGDGPMMDLMALKGSIGTVVSASRGTTKRGERWYEVVVNEKGDYPFNVWWAYGRSQLAKLEE